MLTFPKIAKNSSKIVNLRVQTRINVDLVDAPRSSNVCSDNNEVYQKAHTVPSSIVKHDNNLQHLCHRRCTYLDSRYADL